MGRADDSAGSKKWQWNMRSPSTHCMLGRKTSAEGSAEPLLAPSPSTRRIALQGGKPLPPLMERQDCRDRRELGLKVIATIPLKYDRACSTIALAKEDSCRQN